MIGVFMGSFDPVHNGHKQIVDLMLNQKMSDMIDIEDVNNENKLFSKIVILPAFKNVAKDHSASYCERLMMLNIAFKEEISRGDVEVSTLEMDIACNPPRNVSVYKGVRAVDSMDYFVEQHSGEDVVFITTSETMLEMPTWWSSPVLRKYKYFLVKFDNILNESKFKHATYDVFNIIGEVTIKTPKIHSSNIRKGSCSLRETYMNPDVLTFIKLYNLYETHKNWSYRIKDGEHSGVELWSGRNLAGLGILFKKNSEGKLCLLANLRGPGCPDYKGYWNMPCGYIDGNETALEGIIREISEECGLKLKGKINDQLKLFKLVYVEDEPGYCNGSNVTMRYMGFITDDDIEDDISLNRRHGGEKNEVSEIKWIPIEEYEDYTWAFNHKAIIDDIVKCLDSIENENFEELQNAYESFLFKMKHDK